MFHSSNPSLFGRPDSVLRGSRSIEYTVSELRGACTLLSSNVPHAFSATLHLLTYFSRQLSSYFDGAESSNHFDAIATGCPSLARRARVVERDHEALRKSFAAVEKVGGLEKVCTLGLARHVTNLLDLFEEHEDAERLLLQDFFVRVGDAVAV